MEWSLEQFCDAYPQIEEEFSAALDESLHRRFGFHVTGIDPVHRHLESARAAAGQDGPVFTPGTAEDIPAGPGTAGLVWCRDVLGHSPDLPRAYTEFRRVLRPGGRALIYQTRRLPLARLRPDRKALPPHLPTLITGHQAKRQHHGARQLRA